MSFLQVAWIHFERSAILTVYNQVITRNPRVGGNGGIAFDNANNKLIEIAVIIISVSHENHRTWHLHLNDVQEADRGRYLCQINTAQAKTQSAYLNIVGKIMRSSSPCKCNWINKYYLRVNVFANRQSRRRLKTAPAART